MTIQQWFFLFVTCGVALVGLFIAAGAGQGTMYGLGLLLFAAAIVYAFRQVKQYFDRVDQMHH